jgi:hypothetical protein
MNEKDFDITLQKLKSRGYWRIEFHPSEFESNVVSSLMDLNEIIRDESVHFRGWDIPHFPTQKDDKQDIYPKDNKMYEAWIDWHLYKEVWRFYKSGKFTFLDGLNEHWYDEFNGWGPNPLPNLETGKVVDVINVIYTLTELMYFFHNLAGRLNKIKKWSVRVTLNNINNNQLTLLDRSRIPLHGGYISHTNVAAIIDLELLDTDLKNTKTCLKIAKDASQRVFENFEWLASEQLIEAEQDKLINRRF